LRTGTILKRYHSYNQPRVEEIELKNCRYEKTDEIEALYCEPIKKEGQYYPQGWSLVYDDGELIFAHGQAYGIDGYGPFHYEKKKLVSIYETTGGKYLMFRPGFVIHKNGPIWVRLHREALQYYGECDCAD